MIARQKPPFLSAHLGVFVCHLTRGTLLDKGDVARRGPSNLFRPF